VDGSIWKPSSSIWPRWPSAVDTLAVRAHEKRIELAVRVDSALPPLVVGDPHRLRQILTNLIGNAIKFTERGEVVVKVGRNPESDQSESFLFEVRDTGIGIAPENIENIFSMFSQADTSTTRKFGGSGLGLAIVQRLVALMGGRVWVESEAGRGSTFFFTANLKAAQPTTHAHDDLPLGNLRVLVMAENATMRGVVTEILQAQRCVVAAAGSEAAAIAGLAAAKREGAPIELLLVDCETQADDGFEALRRIRAAYLDAPVILLLNSRGLPLQAAANARARHSSLLRQGYCVKPVKQRDLFGAIADVIAKAAAPETVSQVIPEMTSSGARPNRTTRPLRILLADDSPDNRLLIRAYLKKTPYVLTEAEDGQIAVERFAAGSYDLVLMDIQMPILDGYGAVRAIRKWEFESRRTPTPIIALTASVLEEDVRRAMQAGCEMHISKPVKKPTLLDAIVEVTKAAAVRDRNEEPAVNFI
jgi:two-component system sensor histidine kinase/response regulator